MFSLILYFVCVEILRWGCLHSKYRDGQVATFDGQHRVTETQPLGQAPLRSTG